MIIPIGIGRHTMPSDHGSTYASLSSGEDLDYESKLHPHSHTLQCVYIPVVLWSFNNILSTGWSLQYGIVGLITFGPSICYSDTVKHGQLNSI